MPPRREHFCTSNLEYLQTKGSPFCGKDSTFKVINDSFLGDVLLSAKSEAKFIIDKYKGGNSPDGFKDEETICRALRYSFADLGDIIKGTDLWDENEGEKRTQGHLKEFFQIILNKNPDIEEKYKKIEDKKHLHLREDWWEANRHQVWRAMQCELKNLKKSNGDCHYNSRGTPLDDYIPQRLRWMTEWAEWYCKMQKKEYEKLKEQCKECKAKGDSCNNISSECGKCKDQCKKYKMFVDIWKKQWINISNKYQILYLLAKIDARNVRPSVYFGYEKDKHFLKFFKEIRKENYGKKTYETAEGYVHQEVPHMECKTQNQFCEKKHGDTSSNGEDNTKYTFKQPPPEYKDACGCEGRNKPVSEKKGEDACTIVETLLINKGETDDIDGCNRKYKDPNYPGWDCKNNIDNGNVGACMPPRRQKLCLYYLKELNGETENDLREAFIKTAAAETFLSWHKYKKDKQNEKPSSNPDNELKGGTIPPEFLRSMIYTFGDYRDICMDTDISAKTDKSHVKGAIDNIGKVFSNNGAESRNGLKRDEWWNTYAEDIWKGMLCGLSHAGGGNKETLTTTYTYANVKFSDDKNAPTLEKFAQRPQFLRWFTEWGEDFCKEHKKELETLKGKCDKCDVQDGTCEKESECAECKTQCEEYKKWLKTWQENYKNQKERYNKVKGTREYYNDNDVSAEIQANEYLDKQLKNMTCTNGSTNENCDYMCMGNTSKQQKQASDNTDMPASLEYPPKEINGKCDCKDKQPEPEVSLVPEAPKQGDNACTTVENLFEGEGKTKLKEACALKYGRGKYSAWKCYTDASKPDDGAVCIPPRRQKLYLKYLQELTDGTSPEALRQAFIQSAAIETFFLWDRYKKIKEKEKLEEQARQNGELPFLNGDSVDGGEQNPQTQLKSGTIPTDFLRQMFYTLGDYKDILDGKNIVVDLLSGSSGSDKEMVEREKQIKESIDNYFNSGKGQPSEKKSPDGLTRHQWWEKYGEDIWDEMVCALTYEESGAIGGTPKQNDTMKTTLYDTNTAKEDGKYNYKTVVLKDENSGTQAKTNTPKTTLKDFVLRPTYFRYLEEWGETFCRGRKKRLEKIKEECTENGFGTKQKCSGYGEDCKDNLFNNHYTTFPDFYCHSCAKHCSSYKKWIQRKKEEFTEQANAYKEQQKNCPTQSKATGPNNVGNGFCGTVQRWSNAAAFLQKLGPCKVQNGEDNNKIFDEKGDTFQHTKHCDPCSEFKINCEKAKCSGTNGNNCKGGKISPNDIKDSTEDINMLVSDDNPNGVEDDLDECVLGDCHGAGIFEGIREDVWTCGNVCGYNVCKPKKVDGKTFEGQANGENQIIIIRALFKRWLEYFLQDYNKIRKKLKPCMNNSDGSTCINDYDKTYNCVDEWIKLKMAEWEKIKKHYLEKNEKGDDGMTSLVRNFLEDLQDRPEFKNAIKPCPNLKAFEKSCGLNTAESSQKSEDRKDYDLVLCLIDRLDTKIKKCKEKHQTCTDTALPQTLEDDEEPEDLPLEENENQVVQPNICPSTPAPTEPEEKGACDQAPTTPKEPVPPAPKEVVPEKKVPAAPPKKPEEPPPKVPEQTKENKKPKPQRPKPPQIVYEHPLLKPALMSSTIMWSIGIGFATFTYFYLK
ncbi:hypothetical protein PFFCH_05772, partial [Plasmodium falciparum FCH/4]